MLLVASTNADLRLFSLGGASSVIRYSSGLILLSLNSGRADVGPDLNSSTNEIE